MVNDIRHDLVVCDTLLVHQYCSFHMVLTLNCSAFRLPACLNVLLSQNLRCHEAIITTVHHDTVCGCRAAVAQKI